MKKGILVTKDVPRMEINGITIDAVAVLKGLTHLLLAGSICKLQIRKDNTNQEVPS